MSGSTESRNRTLFVATTAISFFEASESTLSLYSFSFGFPILCISNFSSTNIVTLTSFILKIPHRWNYIHTSPYQINIDSKNNYLTKYLFKIRKILILKMNTHFFTNSNQMSELISKFFKIKKNKISVSPYLIEETKTNYKNYNNRNFSICIVGRLAPSKGHQELLFAFLLE